MTKGGGTLSLNLSGLRPEQVQRIGDAFRNGEHVHLSGLLSGRWIVTACSMSVGPDGTRVSATAVSAPEGRVSGLVDKFGNQVA